MKKSELVEQWTKNIPVAKKAELQEQHHSPRDISLEDAARGWLAFKALYADGQVFINRNHDVNSTVWAQSFYTRTFDGEDNRGLIQKFKDRKKDHIAEWAVENPHNLLLIYRTGADIMKSGEVGCIALEDLPMELAKHKGIEVKNASFPTAEEAESVFRQLFHEADEQHAIDLMEDTVASRIHLVRGIEHS